MPRTQNYGQTRPKRDQLQRAGRPRCLNGFYAVKGVPPTFRLEPTNLFLRTHDAQFNQALFGNRCSPHRMGVLTGYLNSHCTIGSRFPAPIRLEKVLRFRFVLQVCKNVVSGDAPRNEFQQDGGPTARRLIFGVIRCPWIATEYELGDGQDPFLSIRFEAGVLVLQLIDHCPIVLVTSHNQQNYQIGIRYITCQCRMGALIFGLDSFMQLGGCIRRVLRRFACRGEKRFDAISARVVHGLAPF